MEDQHDALDLCTKIAKWNPSVRKSFKFLPAQARQACWTCLPPWKLHKKSATIPEVMAPQQFSSHFAHVFRARHIQFRFSWRNPWWQAYWMAELHSSMDWFLLNQFWNLVHQFWSTNYSGTSTLDFRPRWRRSHITFSQPRWTRGRS